MRNVIFIDVIDVVHCQKFWAKGPNGKPTLHKSSHPRIEKSFNNKQAVQWLSELCEKYNFELVVTSMLKLKPEWMRPEENNLDQWVKLFRDSGLRDSVKITARLNPDDMFSISKRETTIINYINENEVDKFILISSQPTREKNLKSKTIVCTSGFLQREFEEAEKILKSA